MLQAVVGVLFAFAALGFAFLGLYMAVLLPGKEALAALFPVVASLTCWFAIPIGPTRSRP